MVYQQLLQVSISWKHCDNIPTKSSLGKTTVINGKVYYGGYAAGGDLHVVYSYDPQRDNWTTLSPLPVRWFGLGQLNGMLVAVGGRKSNDSSSITNEVYTHDERSKKWKQTIPPMPTSRIFPCVLSLQSALVVAGGGISVLNYTDAVEIFKPDMSQWYRTNPLPLACYNAMLTVIGSTCYALGGYDGSHHLNQVFYTSVDDLFCNALPGNQTTHSSNSDTQSVWKNLASTPTYEPAVATLLGNLFAIGGSETIKGGAAKNKVYMYTPSTDSWMYVSDLPAPQAAAAVAVLSQAELLVIGGQYHGKRVNSVFRGTLQLKM